jgi:hypothetical protein
MSKPTRYGRQPFADFIKEQEYGYCAWLARRLNLSYRQVYKVAHGYVTPSPYLRDQLPVVTGQPPMMEPITMHRAASQRQ